MGTFRFGLLAVSVLGDTAFGVFVRLLADLLHGVQVGEDAPNELLVESVAVVGVGG